MQKVDLPTSFTKLNENCGLPEYFTDYQIRHLGNPSRLPEILLKIDPCTILLFSLNLSVCQSLFTVFSSQPCSIVSADISNCPYRLSILSIMRSDLSSVKHIFYRRKTKQMSAKTEFSVDRQQHVKTATN